MKKSKMSCKDKPHPMLHGHMDGKMMKEMMGKKEPEGKSMHVKKQTAKKKMKKKK